MAPIPANVYAVMDHLTPMMRQYHRIKLEHPDMLLFFRLGDFYEMFFEDAVMGSRELEMLAR